MRRWLANLAVVMSALLMLAALAAWHHSRQFQDTVEYDRHVSSKPLLIIGYRVFSADGTLYLTRRRVKLALVLSPHELPKESRPNGFHVHSMPQIISSFAPQPPRHYPSPNLFNRMGFAYDHKQTWSSIEIMDRWDLILPYWFVIALLSILPLARIITFVRAKLRRVEGCCAVCGYDLRATPDICPECGSAVTMKT